QCAGEHQAAVRQSRNISFGWRFCRRHRDLTAAPVAVAKLVDGEFDMPVNSQSLNPHSIGVTVWAVGCLCLGAAGCSGGGDTRERVVAVAAAADLKFALPEVIQEFERRNPGIRVKVSFGSSGKFFAQLANRAPFDLFLSADMEYPGRLIDAGLADRDSLFVYALGHLVLWAPPGSPVDVERLGTRALLGPAVRKIAIANPRVAPYGQAAEAALRNLHLYEQVKEKLVLGENVAQAVQHVQSGAAQVGIIPLVMARSPVLQGGRFWEVPAEAYPRME